MEMSPVMVSAVHAPVLTTKQLPLWLLFSLNKLQAKIKMEIRNEDPDWLSLVALEERYDPVRHVSNSCQYNLCNDSKLVGAGRASLSQKRS